METGESNHRRKKGWRINFPKRALGGTAVLSSVKGSTKRSTPGNRPAAASEGRRGKCSLKEGYTRSPPGGGEATAGVRSKNPVPGAGRVRGASS